MSVGFIKDGKYVKTAGNYEGNIDINGSGSGSGDLTVIHCQMQNGWSSGTVTCFKKGSIVFVKVNELQYGNGETPTVNSPICIGMPKPVEQFVYTFSGIKPSYAVIDINGNMIVNNFSSAAEVGRVYGSFCYITSE